MYSPFNDGGDGPPKHPPPPVYYPPAITNPNYRANPYMPAYVPQAYYSPNYIPPMNHSVQYQPPPPPYPPPSQSQTEQTQPSKQNQSIDDLLSRMNQQAYHQSTMQQQIHFQPPQNSHKRKKQFSYDFQDKDSQKSKRMKRFEYDSPSGSYPSETAPISNEPLIGTCMELEKDYYRITTDIDPNTVRPEYILKKALQHVNKQWELKAIDYLTLCNQLKSIRQDLMVQHIKNEFAVKVYETHARLALENTDFGEFNQCQTQLVSLYEVNPYQEHEMEFTAYRLLYKLHNGKSRNVVLLHDIQELTTEQRKSSYVIHAMDVCKAYVGNNLYRYFRLYEQTPNMGKKILEFHMEETRRIMLKSLTKGFNGPVELQWISQVLAFENIEECRAFFTTPDLTHKNEKIFIQLRSSKY